MVCGTLGRHKAMGCKPDKLGTFGMQVRLSWRIAAMEEGPQLIDVATTGVCVVKQKKSGPQDGNRILIYNLDQQFT